MADNKKIPQIEKHPSRQPKLQESSQQESLQPQQTSRTQQSTSEQSSAGSSASTSRQEENPSEQSELQKPSQQESLQSQQTHQPQPSTSKQSSKESQASLWQETSKWLAEQTASPTFNPGLLTAEEQIAYMMHKFSRMDETDTCGIRQKRPSPKPKPIPFVDEPPVPLERLPLASPQRRKFYYDQYIARCKRYNPPYAIEPAPRYLPPSWQAVPQQSSQAPPGPQSEGYNPERAREWLSVLKKHEKEQDERNKKEQEEKSKKEQERKEENPNKDQEKSKKKQEEKAKKEEEKAKKEQEEEAKKEEEKPKLTEEEEYMDADSPENPNN